MDVNIPYGEEKIKVNISEKCRILTPNKFKITNDDKIIEEALKKPIGSISFKEFVQKSKKLLVIVNDASKPTPTPKILEHIHPYLLNHQDVKFLVATGTHKPPNNEELRYIFGRFYDIFKDKIFINDSKKQENFKYIGKTTKGTEVHINRMVTDIRNVIVIGSIEPHYFAGYTGGRKAFIPGVSSFKTIEMNHKFALSEKASSLCLKENPVHNDLVDSIRFLKDINIFSIQTVLTSDYKIYSIKCGDIIKSFDELIGSAKKVYCVPIKEKGNIVLTVVPSPMDINLYQSQHALENAKLALEDNGILILVSKCRMGIGNDAFLELLSKANTSQEILDLLNGQYKLGSHKSVRILKIKSKNQIFAVTSLEDKIVEKAKFKPYPDIQSALDNAIKIIKEKGKKPKIIVIPTGNLTVPIIN